MPDYDPTTVALVGEMLKVLDAEADADTMSYEDRVPRGPGGADRGAADGWPGRRGPLPRGRTGHAPSAGAARPEHGDVRAGL